MQRRKLTLKATTFTLINGTLYKRSFTLPYLMCLTLDKAVDVIKEEHEGIYGIHQEA